MENFYTKTLRKCKTERNAEICLVNKQYLHGYSDMSESHITYALKFSMPNMKIMGTNPVPGTINEMIGMILCLVMLFCLFPANSSAKYLFTNHSTQAFEDADTKLFPPSTAVFFMECEVPLLGASDINLIDLCWLDDTTIVLARYEGKQVLKVTVDIQTKTCSYQRVDSGYNAKRVGCSPDGNEFYVTDTTNDYVWVYDRNGLNKAMWKPLGVGNDPYTVALNRELVTVGRVDRSHLYVYNRERMYLYQIMLNENKFQLYCSHLTEEGIFLHVSGLSGRRLVIHDLKDHSTIVVGDGSAPDPFNDPVDVCTAGDYILVADKLNHRVPVYTLNGKFLHHLRFSGTNLQNPFRIDYTPGKQILALHFETNNKIQMFIVGP